MTPQLAATVGPLIIPLVAAGVGLFAAGGLYLAARSSRRAELLLRFLASVALAWAVMCLGYLVAGRRTTFAAYLLASPVATIAMGAAGAGLYVTALVTFHPGDRAWRKSGALLASIVLMGGAFLRAAYLGDAALAVWIQAPLAVLMIATVWRFDAEMLVYLAILAVAVTAALAGPIYVLKGEVAEARGATASAAAGVSLAMALAGSVLGFRKPSGPNLRWYRQGLLIIPLVVSTLAAAAAGAMAVWYGATWHTVWALGAWWAVLLIGSIGLGQPDLFGFSSVGAGMTAVAAFAVYGGAEHAGYWGRYPAVLMAMSVGVALLALVLTFSRREKVRIFGRALYLASVVIAVGALAIEPVETSHKYLGIDLMVAAGVLALSHPHGAPPWMNYLVAILATGGVASLATVPPGASASVWHHRFLQVMAGTSVAWLLVAIVVRTILRATSSYRRARREAEPLIVFGMLLVLIMAAYLTAQQTRAYAELMLEGTSPTRALLGPVWGLVAWLAVLLGFALSLWLLRHTARTVLFYAVGIGAVIYLGLLIQADGPAAYQRELYGFLIYAVAGYGSAHLLVYLYEARFMSVLARITPFYGKQMRASTTIFTLAMISCSIGAIMAALRLETRAALVMLGIMAIVFLVWTFVWLRHQMLYPAVVMVTLAILAVWHNVEHPQEWDAYRLGVNAAVMTFSALVWLGIGHRLDTVHGEIFELAGPARACSLLLAIIGSGFAVALALSPAFPADVWRASRTVGNWALGLTTLLALTGYFAWAGHVSSRRVYYLASGLIVLLLGLYVGLYLGTAGARF